jgi:uncharacterized protein YjaZ
LGIQIYILDASGNLKSQRDLLRKYVRLTVRKIQRKIALKNIDIVIKESENPELFKDIDGIAGWCPNGHFVQLNIDINHPSFRMSPRKLIEKTLIHELHHAARIQAGILMNKGSFLEYLFSEGLADYFVYELTGDLGKWVPPINTEDKIRLLRRVKKISSNKFTNKDHRDWFVQGSKSLRIPQFAGYAVGFEVVKNFLTKNPDKSAASLVKTPVAEILPLL